MPITTSGHRAASSVANAPPSEEPIANALSMYTPSQLAANGITPGETVGQWQASVAAKIGNAASQSVPELRKDQYRVDAPSGHLPCGLMFVSVSEQTSRFAYNPISQLRVASYVAWMAVYDALVSAYGAQGTYAPPAPVFAGPDLERSTGCMLPPRVSSSSLIQYVHDEWAD